MSIMTSDYWLSRVIQGLVGMAQICFWLAVCMSGLILAWMVVRKILIRVLF